jgi:DNA-binding response OmpR family regulator
VINKIMRKNRILIVDDEDDNNLLFKMVLEDDGFKVDTFNDPLVALQNFTAGSYDLLLLEASISSCAFIMVAQT